MGERFIFGSRRTDEDLKNGGLKQRAWIERCYMQLQNDRLEFVPDVPSVLPIVVWGTGTDGEIFRHSAGAKELREDGALLTGILHPVATGDLVGVQYQQHKAHARVTKATKEDEDHHWLLWVQLLEKSRCPWAGVAQTVASPPCYDCA